MKYKIEIEENRASVNPLAQVQIRHIEKTFASVQDAEDWCQRMEYNHPNDTYNVIH